MTRPVIGLTVDWGDRTGRYELNGDYVASVEKAGGLPLAIPFGLDPVLIPQILDRLDGILFIGGDDLDPALYGEAWHEKAIRIDRRRQDFELALLAEAERRQIPAMGICLGCQLFNVHRGGTLHQFLPHLPRQTMIEHRKADRQLPQHTVRIEPNSRLGQAIGQVEILANTYHKQAIKSLGRGLRAVASAPDGVAEAIEDPTLPLFVAVQWHPERLHHRPEHLAIFELLVDKASVGR